MNDKNTSTLSPFDFELTSAQRNDVEQTFSPGITTPQMNLQQQNLSILGGEAAGQNRQEDQSLTKSANACTQSEQLKKQNSNEVKNIQMQPIMFGEQLPVNPSLTRELQSFREEPFDQRGINLSSSSSSLLTVENIEQENNSILNQYILPEISEEQHVSNMPSRLSLELQRFNEQRNRCSDLDHLSSTLVKEQHLFTTQSVSEKSTIIRDKTKMSERQQMSNIAMRLAFEADAVRQRGHELQIIQQQIDRHAATLNLEPSLAKEYEQLRQGSNDIGKLHAEIDQKLRVTINNKLPHLFGEQAKYN